MHGLRFTSLVVNLSMYHPFTHHMKMINTVLRNFKNPQIDDVTELPVMNGLEGTLNFQDTTG